MTKRNKLVMLAAAFMLLSIPAAGHAQGRYAGNQRNTRVNRYYNSRLKESVKRVDKLSGQLKDALDSALDRSRLDGRNREDRINEIANDFHSAAAQFKDKFDDGRNPDNAAQEARRVIDLGAQLDRVIGRSRPGRQMVSRWAQIRSDLRVIENAYR